jgi:hypothetical protein
MIHKKELVDHLCGYFGTTVEELSKRNRHNDVVVARQMIMTYLYNHTTFADAASVFGQDHATAVHAKRTVGNLSETNKIFAIKWNDFTLHANRFFDSIEYRDIKIFFLKGIPTVDIGNKMVSFNNLELAKSYIDGIYDGLEMKELIVVHA